ncbi:Hypothetical_protein [Hexamita inflata]|uniref:Hypothetical_protein n=1 Tax=Hexamita inflata TaxID=28002 RepID=A0AA86U7T3_9EUKA|nr:Hypothetical protein HINF_LOCUS32219 [Hexamita inflata]
MLSSIILYRQLNQFNQCTNNIWVNNEQYGYCHKAKYFNNVISKNVLSKNDDHNPKNIQLFMYTDITKQSNISIEVLNENVNAFALFGFNLSTNVVRDSLVNISLGFEVFHGALVCIKCDVEIYNCSLVFIASGKELSGLVGEAPNSVFLQQSLIQYRLASMHTSGIVNRIDNANANVTIVDCNLTGSNLIESDYSGYIACEIVSQMNMTISSFVVCVDSNLSLGNQSANITFNGAVTLSCDVCGGQMVVYGLCGDSLQYAQPHSGMLTCDLPFEFVDGQCQCEYGYLLDGSVCVNVIEAIHNMSSQMQNNDQIQQIILSINNFSVLLENLTDYSTNAITNITMSVNNQFTKIENDIKLNYSQLHQLLANYTNIIDQSISNNISLNISQQQLELENYLALNTSALNNRLISNISMLNLLGFNTSLEDLKTKIQNYQNLCQSQNYDIAVNSMNATVYNMNTTFNQTNMILQQTINTQSMLINQSQYIIDLLEIQIACLNQGYQFLNNQCIITYQIQCDHIVCGQNIQVSVFDISVITHQVSSGDFSAGYVFSSSPVINNAFIDVFDGVYATAKPLFQSQNTFQNIKIHIGTQSVNGGSMLTMSSTIIINQLTIMSSEGSDITVSAGQLNIFVQSTSNVNIQKLLINLVFSPSSMGNITLIDSVSGSMNISIYKVFGTYQTTLTAAMIGLSINSANINVKQTIFKPDVMYVGNCSSYLFTTVVSSTITINNIAIIMGNKTNFMQIGSITTTNWYSPLFYQFGGIISLYNSSTINTNQLIQDSYQKIVTDYISKSGFLLGFVLHSSSPSNITFSNLCLQQNMSSIVSQKNFSQFGLINSDGSIKVYNSTISFSVQGSIFIYFGLIATHSQTSTYLEFSNVNTSVSMAVGATQLTYIGALIGWQGSKNASIINTQVINSNITSKQDVGGFIGRSYTSADNTTILNSTLINSTISASLNTAGGFIAYHTNKNVTLINSMVSSSNISSAATISGGFVGHCQSTTLHIESSSVLNIRVTGTTSLGFILGSSGTGNTFELIYSYPIGTNYINGVVQGTCTLFTSATIPKGC